MAFLGGILIGGNKDQVTTFFVGDGSNGKSLLLKALEFALGDYCKEVSKDIYTVAKKHAGGPEPHLIELKGRLLGATVETEKTDVFLSAVFKKMSAEDKITTRNCHEKKQTEFMPMYKPIVCTNELPKFSNFDAAVERRIRIFTFPYMFVEVVTEDNHKKIDKDMAEKLQKPEFINQFINLLAKYCKKKVVDTPNRIEAVKSYVKENNPIADWFDTNYDLTGNKADKISTTEMFKDYAEKEGVVTQTTFGKNLKKLVTVVKGSSMYAVGITKKNYNALNSEVIIPMDDDDH